MRILCWLLIIPLSVLATSSDIELLKRQPERRTKGGLHVPLLRRKSSKLHRRGQTGAIGLGDFQDVTYNVLVKIGGIETSVVLDTGSSDLWVISDACKGNCTSSVPLYPQSTFQATGLDVALQYGDSSTGTHALGPIGKDTVGIADLMLQNQYFAAINNTNTSVLDVGSAGIFGLGFPINSVIWMQVFNQNPPAQSASQTKRAEHHLLARAVHNFAIRFFPKTFNFYRPTFPSLSSLKPHLPRQSASTLPEILASFSSLGPFLSRLVAQSALAAPMVTIALQRDAVEVGGNLGMLAIGELPASVKNESLTWVQVRGYTPSEGGLTAPPDFPDELYPIAWEIPLDDVYFDGQKLAQSKLTTNITLSALLDTGNSLIRGPTDVIKAIVAQLGGDNNGNFPCADAHTLAFEFGGKMFPVDPRDLVSQVNEDSVDLCSPTLAATDPPQVGSGYLYSWSLGDPFLKSVLTSFYYGNLTYPSQDPARIGLLSTVPTDASAELTSAVATASANGGNFPVTSDAAPSGTPKAASTGIQGVPQALTSSSSSASSGIRPTCPQFWSLILSLTSFVFLR